jgi:hypothetical protein
MKIQNAVIRGTIAEVPSLSSTPSGKPCLRFSINGGADDTGAHILIILIGDKANHAAKAFRAGDHIRAEGEARLQCFVRGVGEARAVLSVMAKSVEKTGAKNQALELELAA